MKFSRLQRVLGLDRAGTALRRCGLAAPGLQRVVAILVLLVIAGQWLPLVMQSVERELPACCRAKGSHHCAMSARVPGEGPAFSAVSSKCPFYPAQAETARAHIVLGTAPSQVYLSELASLPAVIAQAEAQLRVSYDRSRQKRGPPSLSLS
jgi:hypothetical protein